MLDKILYEWTEIEWMTWSTEIQARIHNCDAAYLRTRQTTTMSPKSTFMEKMMTVGCDRVV